MPRTAPSTIILLSRSLALAGAALAAGCASSEKEPPAYEDFAERRDTAKAIALGEQAERAFEKGDIDEAYNLYIQAIEADKRFYPNWNNLGHLLMTDNSYLEAAEAFKQASALRPDDPVPEYNLGLIFANRRHFREALDHYRQSLDRDANYLPALRGAIVASVEIREPTQEALDWIHHAQFLDPDTEWLNYYQTHRLRLESLLAEQKQP